MYLWFFVFPLFLSFLSKVPTYDNKKTNIIERKLHRTSWCISCETWISLYIFSFWCCRKMGWLVLWLLNVETLLCFFWLWGGRLCESGDLSYQPQYAMLFWLCEGRWYNWLRMGYVHQKPEQAGFSWCVENNLEPEMPGEVKGIFPC